ncbi:MAG: phospholipase D-like domain-containing protein [Nitratireductor sp.]|nr:phospholipase D-like domain-containing protein [Nitratireductor sp.]
MNWALVHLTVAVAALAFLFVAMATRQQHRSPQSAFAWLLFAAFVPYLAIPAFLALGNRKTLPGRRIVHFGHEGPPDGLSRLSASIDKLAARSGLPGAIGGNSLDLVMTGRDAHEVLAAQIAGAGESIEMTFYKFQDDEVGRDIAARLTARARQGVPVRLLLDGYGSRNRPRRALRELEEAGGKVRIFSPLVPYPVRGHINLRNHRKTAIFDRRTVFAGGMNIAREYLGEAEDHGQWSDLGYVLKGPSVSGFEQLFASDWARAANEKPAIPGPVRPSAAGTATVQLIPSGPDIREDVLHDAIVLACHQAQRRISIVTPYFLPSSAIAGALSIAVRRGIPVTLTVPRRSNQRLADLARASFLREMSEAGVKVLAHPGMVHAKALIIDDCGFVGSANLDIRSLYVNFESMLLLHDHEDTEKLSRWMERVEGESVQWRPEHGILKRLAEIVFRLGAPMM